MFDFGLNCISVTMHMIKARESNGGGEDALEVMADDLTIKELMAIVNQDTQSLQIMPFNLTSD